MTLLIQLLQIGFVSAWQDSDDTQCLIFALN